jgi:predicted dehydrogenase
MGMTHLKAYGLQGGNVRVVAIADVKFADATAILGRAGNIAGQAAEVCLDAFSKYTTAEALLADPRVHAVDICAPTHAHKELAIMAIRAGKSVLVEKPLARTAADACAVAEAARDAGIFLMPAHCMRFWPGWDWLKTAVEERRYGAVQSATFTRVGAKPGDAFYNNGAACGGAHLDLHIHDTDFVLHLFGLPSSVTSFGRKGESGAVEHTLTHYHFDGTDALVVAEGAWTRESEKRPFIMRYSVTFERATATYVFGDSPALTLYQPGHDPVPVALASTLGYDGEIAEFVRCVETARPSDRVTATDGFNALRIIEAELRSIETGQTVSL